MLDSSDSSNTREIIGAHLCFPCGQVFHPHVQQDLYWNKLGEIKPGPAMHCACFKDTHIKYISILFLISNGLLRTLKPFYHCVIVFAS